MQVELKVKNKENEIQIKRIINSELDSTFINEFLKLCDKYHKIDETDVQDLINELGI